MPKAAKKGTPGKGGPSPLAARAARQQAAVNELFVCMKKINGLINEGQALFDPGHEFVDGQLNVHMCTASTQLELAIECFADCAEDGVEVPDVSA